MKCDALASHPDDPEARKAGIPDTQLDAKQVIAACRPVARAYPRSPRLAFQLARGYLKADQVEDAIEQLVAAAKLGHGGALAYLAELHLEGAPGLEEDPELAVALLTQAAQSGFTPATRMLAQFEDFTDKVAAADAEEARMTAQADSVTQGTPAGRGGGRESYHHAALVDNVLQGKLDDVPYNERWAKMFLLEMAESISVVCEAHFSKRDILQLKQDSVFRGADMSAGAGVQNMLGALMQASRMMENPGSYMAEASQAGIDQQMLPEEAMQDTSVLLDRHRCASPQIAQFSTHLTSYVRGDNMPRMSADDMLNNCRRNSGRTRANDANNFCMCFLGLTSQAPMSRADRKGLVTDFKQTSDRLIANDRRRFGMCS